jgi:hypothetical protein
VVALSDVLQSEATRPPPSSPSPEAGERRKATLDDVFLALTGRSLREDNTSS